MNKFVLYAFTSLCFLSNSVFAMEATEENRVVVARYFANESEINTGGRHINTSHIPASAVHHLKEKIFKKGDEDAVCVTNELFLALEEHPEEITTLTIGSNPYITGELFEYLPRLNSLTLRSNYTIKNEDVSKLTNLTHLDVFMSGIGREALPNLINLTSFVPNTVMRDEDMIHLTNNVQSLNLKFNRFITAKGVLHLTNLTDLKQPDWTFSDIVQFPHLASLTVSKTPEGEPYLLDRENGNIITLHGKDVLEQAFIKKGMNVIIKPE